MTHQVFYHLAVDQDDFPLIDARLRTRILKAIEQRLASEPSYYGELLRDSLRRYWKLRVGDYRIIYRIVGREVWIYRIGHRKTVYSFSSERLAWQPH